MTRWLWLFPVVTGCLGERVGAVEQDVADVQDGNDQLGTDVASLTARIEALEAQVATHTTGLAAQSSSIADLTDDVAANTTAIAANTTAIATNTTAIASHESDLAAIESDLGDVQTALDSAGSCVVVTGETEVFDGTTPTAWTDLDLSGTVGTGPAVVALKVTNGGSAGYVNSLAFRPNGDTGDYVTNQTPLGSNKVNLAGPGTSGMVVIHTPDGIVEWKVSDAVADITVDLVMYVTCE